MSWLLIYYYTAQSLTSRNFRIVRNKRAVGSVAHEHAGANQLFFEVCAKNELIRLATLRLPHFGQQILFSSYSRIVILSSNFFPHFRH